MIYCTLGSQKIFTSVDAELDDLQIWDFSFHSEILLGFFPHSDILRFFQSKRICLLFVFGIRSKVCRFIAAGLVWLHNLIGGKKILSFPLLRRFRNLPTGIRIFLLIYILFSRFCCDGVVHYSHFHVFHCKSCFLYDYISVLMVVSIMFLILYDVMQDAINLSDVGSLNEGFFWPLEFG